MLIGLDTGGGEEEQESHSKVGTLLGPTIRSTLIGSSFELKDALSNFKDDPHQGEPVQRHNFEKLKTEYESTIKL